MNLARLEGRGWCTNFCVKWYTSPAPLEQKSFLALMKSKKSEFMDAEKVDEPWIKGSTGTEVFMQNREW